jgi:hypothetical protein
MVVEVEKTGAAVGFLDPECFCLTKSNNRDDTLAFSMSYMHHAFKLYTKQKLILTAYLSKNQWIAVVIVPKQHKVYYLNSFKSIKTDTTPFNLIINE